MMQFSKLFESLKEMFYAVSRANRSIAKGFGEARCKNSCENQYGLSEIPDRIADGRTRTGTGLLRPNGF
jgi:hypothetical protein